MIFRKGLILEVAIKDISPFFINYNTYSHRHTCSVKKFYSLSFILVYVFSPISSIFLYKNDQILSGKNDIVAATFVPKLYNSESNPEWHEAATIWFFNAAKVCFVFL